MKKYIYAVSVFALFSLAFAALPSYYESSGFLQKCSFQTRDLFFKIRRWSVPPSDKIKDIVIVSIDEDSCEKLDARWPWPRKVFASMLENLTGAGARAVGLNVSFTGLEGTDSGSTEALAEAMRAHGNVVIGDTFSREGQVIRPIAIIADAVSRYGYLEKIIDDDFVIRRSYLLRPYRDSSRFETSFPLQLAAAASGPGRENDARLDPDLGLLTVGNPHLAVSVDTDGSYVINYTAVETDFRQIPAWQAVQGKLDAADVKGKIVLVGLTSALFGDRHPTPLGVLSGVAIHANELLSILSSRNLRFVSVNFAFWFAWLLGAVVLAIFLFHRLWVGIAAAGLVFFGAFLGSEVLFARDYILEPFILFTGIFLGTGAGMLSNSVKLFLENKGLETKIIHDKMTGLYNYDFLRTRLEEEWKSSKKTRHPLTIVMTDLDRFKKINDTLGHETGNEMIKRAGAVLKQTARGYDVVARYGGDEFFVFLWHTGHEEAKAYRERLRNAYHEMARALAEPGLQDSSISIGIATFDPKIDPKHPENPQKLLEEADKDLFTDKESRRKPGEARR